MWTISKTDVLLLLNKVNQLCIKRNEFIISTWLTSKAQGQRKGDDSQKECYHMMSFTLMIVQKVTHKIIVHLGYVYGEGENEFS